MSDDLELLPDLDLCVRVELRQEIILVRADIL